MPAKNLNRLCSRRFDGGVLTQERDLQVVVDLVALIRIRPEAEIRDGGCGGGEGERLDGLFLEADAPAQEAVKS